MNICKRLEHRLVISLVLRRNIKVLFNKHRSVSRMITVRITKIYFILLFFLTILLSGCSPFGNASLIEIVSNGISDLFDTKTTAELNSGGGRNLITSPASLNSADVHQITVSVGNVYQQNTYVTPQGHTVEVIVSCTRQ